MKRYLVDNVPDGFSICRTPEGGEPCLVKIYEHEGNRFAAYGRWDGGGFVPLSDMSEGVTFEPVAIVPIFNFDFEP